MNHKEIIDRLLALDLSPLPVAPYQAEPQRNGKPVFTGKNPSYLTGGAIAAALVTHSAYQNKRPLAEELTIWFKLAKTGIGCLGSDRYRWLDLDCKHFATQGDCDLALLQICPNAQDGWLERTQSGGYRLLIDCGEDGAKFTNFTLTEGGDHVGELLGAGRFAVLAPTVGVNGSYKNINYGDPIPFTDLNIYPANIKKANPVAPALIKPSSLNSIPLDKVISKAHRDSLNGVYEGGRDNEGAALARDLIGAHVWLLSNGYSTDGDPYTLLRQYCSKCVPPLDDRDCERIYKSALKDNPEPCLSHDKLQNCVDAYLRSLSVVTRDLRYSAPVKIEHESDIDLLSLLPKKYIEAVRYGCEKPLSIISTIKGIAIATEEYLINKSIKYQGCAREIFEQFCNSQEPQLQADFESMPTDHQEVDIPAIKKLLDAHDRGQKKIAERIEKETIKAERERLKAESKNNEVCKLAQYTAIIREAFGDRFKLNLLTNEIELDGKVFDIDQSRLKFSNELNIEVNKNDAVDIIANIAESNAYHPIFNYLEDCHKRLGDDTSILNELASYCFGVSNPLYEVFVKKTLIAAVARVYYPNTLNKVAKVDHVLCLVGRQGAKKSSFFEALAGEDFFTDNLDKELSSKDNLMRLHRKWICEIGEIDRVTNSKYEGDLKNFITIKTDQMRFPYRRAIKNLHRHFLFVGSSNREDFLTDSTGDRRYWLLRTGSKINCDFVRQYRDQIWAAAVSLFKNGAEWWLSEAEQHASDINNRRYQSDSAWMPIVAEFCNGKARVSTSEILFHIEPEKARHSNAMQRDIVNCLIRLGYSKNGSKHRVVINGMNMHVNSWVEQGGTGVEQGGNPYPVGDAANQQKTGGTESGTPQNPCPVTVPNIYVPHNTHNTHNTYMDQTYIDDAKKSNSIYIQNEKIAPPPQMSGTVEHKTQDVSAEPKNGVPPSVPPCTTPTPHGTAPSVFDMGKPVINIKDQTTGIFTKMDDNYRCRYGDYEADIRDLRLLSNV